MGALDDYVADVIQSEDSNVTSPAGTIFKNGQLVQRIVLDNKNTSEIGYYPITTFDNVKGEYNNKDVSLTGAIKAIDDRWNDAFNTDSIALGPSAKKNSFGISLGQNAGSGNSIIYNFEFNENTLSNPSYDDKSLIYTFTLWNRDIENGLNEREDNYEIFIYKISEIDSSLESGKEKDKILIPLVRKFLSEKESIESSLDENSFICQISTLNERTFEIKVKTNQIRGNIIIFKNTSESSYQRNAISIGSHSSIDGVNNLSIGRMALAQGNMNIAIGTQARIKSSVNGEKSHEGIAIGDEALVQASGGISLGMKTSVLSSGGVSIGNFATVKTGCYAGLSLGLFSVVDSWNGIAIGYKAEVAPVEGGKQPHYAIQIGEGTNTKPGTFQVRGWQLLDNLGKIPKDRLSIYYGQSEAGNAENVQKVDGKPLEGTVYFKLKS